MLLNVTDTFYVFRCKNSPMIELTLVLDKFLGTNVVLYQNISLYVLQRCYGEMLYGKTLVFDESCIKRFKSNTF